MRGLVLVAVVVGGAAHAQSVDAGAPPPQEEAPLGPEVLEEGADAAAPLGPEVLDEAPAEGAPVPAAPAEGAPVPAAPAEGAPPPAAPAEGVPPPAAEPPADLPDAPADDAVRLDTISILGEREDLPRVSGSAHVVGKEQLEKFEHDDIHRVLEKVPGVYVRDEEGFGLRPNIGLRGATSDRSRKVTLEEDGVLMAPAPYAAPAAYFFPLTTRMVGVEVFKGPASIEHGPQTIGGAINMVTRPVPRKLSGAIDVAGGQFRFGKAHAWVGQGDDRWGFLVEGVHLQSEGFRDLDGGGNTGFDKNELMLKGRWNTDLGDDVYHQVDLKLGYADEVSPETYLGLTEADFGDTSYRRYAGSQRDLMEWTRTQMELRYTLTVGEDFDVRVTGYRHDFERSWRKLNRFQRGPALDDLLKDPASGTNPVYLGVLRGDEDSTAAETLLVGANDREFVSQGVQVNGTWRLPGDWFGQSIKFGIRLHNDSIARVHDELGHQMLNGTLVPDRGDADIVTKNRDEALAWAFHALDEVRLGESLYLTPGVRLEIIRLEHRDDLADTSDDRTDVVVIPGLGAFYAITENVGALAGVHRGFSPVAPGQDDAIDPETSINYEAGVRFAWPLTRGELIGFFNDYENLSGVCTFSSGCDPNDIDRQFDGGEVDVYGAEVALGQKVPLWGAVALNVDVSYTLTLAEFKTSFTSDFEQFGDVQEGDALPYVPAHQVSASVGLGSDRWGVDVSVLYTGEMLDVAGDPDALAAADKVPSRTVVDVAARYGLSERDAFYGKVDNLLDEAYIASRRPFGVRAGKPRQVVVGYKHSFE